MHSAVNKTALFSASICWWKMKTIIGPFFKNGPLLRTVGETGGSVFQIPFSKPYSIQGTAESSQERLSGLDLFVGEKWKAKLGYLFRCPFLFTVPSFVAGCHLVATISSSQNVPRQIEGGKAHLPPKHCSTINNFISLRACVDQRPPTQSWGVPESLHQACINPQIFFF